MRRANHLSLQPRSHVQLLATIWDPNPHRRAGTGRCTEIPRRRRTRGELHSRAGAERARSASTAGMIDEPPELFSGPSDHTSTGRSWWWNTIGAVSRPPPCTPGRLRAAKPRGPEAGYESSHARRSKPNAARLTARRPRGSGRACPWEIRPVCRQSRSKRRYSAIHDARLVGIRRQIHFNAPTEARWLSHFAHPVLGRRSKPLRSPAFPVIRIR